MKNRYLIIVFFVSLMANSLSSQVISNESYITGEDGVIRMYINLMGHVKNPSTYLVYDKIDFMSPLSMAGGYLQGADLKNIIIYSENGESKKINLYNYLNSNSKDISHFNLKPHDTIYIKQKSLSKFFMSSNLPTIFLSMINLAITLKNTD